MELEALKSRFDEKLGSTKLQLSEQTLNEVLQDALAEIGDDDTRLTDDFISRKVNLAKKIDGQINFDVSKRIKKWKEDNQQTPPNNLNPQPDEEPSYFKDFRENVEEKFASLERARKEEELKLQKASALKRINDELESKFKEAGIKKNAYIFKQTLKDVTIPDKDIDISAIVKRTEKEYYQNLKEAGFEDTTPHVGGNGGGGNKLANDFFAQKAKREGWGNTGK